MFQNAFYERKFHLFGSAHNKSGISEACYSRATRGNMWS